MDDGSEGAVRSRSETRAIITTAVATNHDSLGKLLGVRPSVELLHCTISPELAASSPDR